MKKQLVMLTRGDQLPSGCVSNFIARPCALSDSNGLPHKGNKSKATDFFETRYKRFDVIVSAFPSGWIPDSVILEGMFLIQTAPAPGVSTFRQYTDILLNRFIHPHIRAGATEVHVLFDDPDNSIQSPKEIERQKRDNSVHIDSEHECVQIEPEGVVPTDWRGKLLNCRKCKRLLCEFLGQEMIQLVPSKLRENQTFFTAGGFLNQHRNQCWSVTRSGDPQPLPYLWSDAEETDLRIWLHCKHSTGSKKMLYSPDTDVYHIGLPLLEQTSEIYIQLHGRRKDSNRYLHVNKLVQALHSDPDLTQVPVVQRTAILQMVYVATGCDYISYFKGIGKVFFLNVLYQHATFITAGLDPGGSLADITMENTKMGLLAFVRLVGCAYFKKHLTGFRLDTPEALFHSITADSEEKQHRQWLDLIRNTVRERTADESHYV